MSNFEREHTRFPGWLRHTPATCRARALIDEITVMHDGLPIIGVEVTNQPHSTKDVVLSKLGVYATTDEAFWLGHEFNTFGSVAYIPPSIGRLTISPDGYRADEAYLYDPHSRSFTQAPIGPLKVPIDSSANQQLVGQLEGLGVPTLLHTSYLPETTKDKTPAIAERCKVRAPLSYAPQPRDSLLDIYQFFTSNGIQDVVIKPKRGQQGKDVVFAHINDMRSMHQFIEAQPSEYVIEERIIPDALDIDGVVHDWNIRAVIVEGKPIDWYVRASATGGPVNICLGAFLLTRRDMHDYMTPDYLKRLSKHIENDSVAIGKEFPKGIQGLDFIVRGGKPYLIEVNSGMVVCGSFPDYSHDPSSMAPNERMRFAKRITKAYRSASSRFEVPGDQAPVNLYNEPTYFDLMSAAYEIESLLVEAPVLALTNTIDLIDYLERTEIDFFGASQTLSVLSSLVERLLRSGIIDKTSDLIPRSQALLDKCGFALNVQIASKRLLNDNPNELVLSAELVPNTPLGITLLLRALNIQPAHINARCMLDSYTIEFSLYHRQQAGPDLKKYTEHLLSLVCGLNLAASANLKQDNKSNPDLRRPIDIIIDDLFELSDKYPDIVSSAIDVILETLESPGVQPTGEQGYLMSVAYYLDSSPFSAAEHWFKNQASGASSICLDNAIAEIFGIGIDELDTIRVFHAIDSLTWSEAQKTAELLEVKDTLKLATLLYIFTNGTADNIPTEVLEALIETNEPLAIYTDFQITSSDSPD